MTITFNIEPVTLVTIIIAVVLILINRKSLTTEKVEKLFKFIIKLLHK